MASEQGSLERLERRALSRRVCEGGLPLAARAGHEYWKAALHDISPGGLGIRVVHVTPRASGLWVAGNTFLQRLSDDEFEALLR